MHVRIYYVCWKHWGGRFHDVHYEEATDSTYFKLWMILGQITPQSHTLQAVIPQDCDNLTRWLTSCWTVWDGVASCVISLAWIHISVDHVITALERRAQLHTIPLVVEACLVGLHHSGFSCENHQPKGFWYFKENHWLVISAREPKSTWFHSLISCYTASTWPLQHTK